MQDVDKLLKENSGLVYYCISEYLPKLLNDDDAFAIGQITLWKSILKFDSSRGTAFSTYAIQAIKNALVKYFLDCNFYQYNTVTLDETYETIPDIKSEISIKDIEFNISFEQALSQLNDIEQSIIKDVIAGKTYREISLERYITPQRANQIAIKARNKIKKYMEGKNDK